MVKEIRQDIRSIKICLYCKQEFEKPSKLSIGQWKERIFCSNSCKGEFRKQQHNLFIKCKFCGQVFRKSVSYKNKRFYCSRKCYWEDLKNRMKGQIAWNKGKKCPQISEVLKGRKLPQKTRDKMSEARKKEWKEEKRKPNLLWKKGKESLCWKGGLSFEPYSVDWNETLKRSIRERDNYICQLCSQYGNNVHHIDYNKKNCNPKNLITLCQKCNIKVNKNRDYWQNYFKQKRLE